MVGVGEATSMLTVFCFTNFVAGEKLISLLEKGHTIRVTIISPKELVDKIDIASDSFSLNGFIASRLKAQEYCEELK